MFCLKHPNFFLHIWVGQSLITQLTSSLLQAAILPEATVPVPSGKLLPDAPQPPHPQQVPDCTTVFFSASYFFLCSQSQQDYFYTPRHPSSKSPSHSQFNSTIKVFSYLFLLFLPHCSTLGSCTHQVSPMLSQLFPNTPVSCLFYFDVRLTIKMTFHSMYHSFTLKPLIIPHFIYRKTPN